MPAPLSAKISGFRMQYSDFPAYTFSEEGSLGLTKLAVPLLVVVVGVQSGKSV